jgi:UDP-glucose:(heptosyl)LPS alpha-1,3-glucosyltransferase
MKIALCFPGCHTRGGVERVVQQTAIYLAGRGHEIHVFANRWDPLENESIHFHAVPMFRRPEFLRAPTYFRACTAMLRPEEFDVVNVHGCECPTGHVFRLHSLHRAWLESSRRFRGPVSLGRLKQRLNPLHPFLLRLEAKHFRGRRYRRVIALSESVREDLHRHYGVPPSDVDVIPNGFSPETFNPTRRAERREEMRKEIGLNPDQPAMLFVANELYRKGYPVILEAMKRLNRRNLQLLVVGGVNGGEVMRLAAAAGVADQVHALGPTRDVAGYHAAADFFVLPTQYEAFCLAVLEALGSGLPVITSRVPGAYDAIQSGVNGLIIDDPMSAAQLADSIGVLLDADKCAKFSADAPGTVEAYHLDAVMARFEQALCRNAAGAIPTAAWASSAS